MSDNRRDLRLAWWLSLAAGLLMATSAAGGLWVEGYYRDPPEVRAVLRGYDLVTLAVVVPLLAGTLVAVRRGPGPSARLLWTGILIYAVYNCMTVLLGSVFNDFFLLQVSLLPASIAALVVVVLGLDADDIRNAFRPCTPMRTVSVLLAVAAISLGGMWGYSALRYAVLGEAPSGSALVLPASSVHLGYVMDLGLLVPALLVGAVLSWRRTAWGYVLAPSLLAYLVLCQVNYVTALVFQSRAGIPGAQAYDPVEPYIMAVLLAAAAAMFAGLRRPRPSGPGGPPAVGRSRR
ncbi:hypothetical protein ACWEWP_27920 [Streptomyces olivaceus]